MSKPAPHLSPLLQSVIARASLPVVTMETVDDFLAGHRNSMLFFSGDWERLAESNDVAVVLPELQRLSPGLGLAVVAREAERPLQLRYRFNKFPAIVLSRGAGYLGVITGMRDWSDYGQEIAAILAGEVCEPPPFELPQGCVANGAPVKPSLQQELLIH